MALRVAGRGGGCRGVSRATSTSSIVATVALGGSSAARVQQTQEWPRPARLRGHKARWLASNVIAVTLASEGAAAHGCTCACHTGAPLPDLR